MLAAHRPHQAEVRDVGRRDDEHERRRAHEEVECQPRALTQDLAEGDDADAVSRSWVVRLLEVRLDALTDGRHLGPRLFQRSAGREPGDHLGHAVRAAVHHHRAGMVLGDDHVEERVHPVGKRRGRLHHADYLDVAAVDAHHLSDDSAVSPEPALPVLVREHHDRGHTGPVIGVPERTAQDRRQAHDLEVIPGDEPHVDPHRIVLALQRVRHLRILGDPLQRLRAVAEIEDLGHGEEDVLATRPIDRLPQVDEPVPVAMGQGPEQDAAHDAEDGGVGADAESKRQDDGERESRRSG